MGLSIFVRRFNRSHHLSAAVDVRRWKGRVGAAYHTSAAAALTSTGSFGRDASSCMACGRPPDAPLGSPGPLAGGGSFSWFGRGRLAVRAGRVKCAANQRRVC